MGDHQVYALAAIGPEPDATEAPALPAAQLQLEHLAAQRRCTAMDLGVTTQAHDVAPTGPPAEPAQQFIARECAIRQECDRPESGQKLVGLLQQGDRDRGADACTGMLQGLPQQRNGPDVSHHREHHNAEAVPQHRGVEGQMQAVVWLLPLLERPEHKRAIQHLNVDATVDQPALTAALPAGRQTTGRGQPGIAAIETNGLARRQPNHHPSKQHQMTLITDGAVLTQEADQLSMDTGRRCHRDLHWFRSPTLSWLPAHPIS